MKLECGPKEFGAYCNFFLKGDEDRKHIANKSWLYIVLQTILGPMPRICAVLDYSFQCSLGNTYYSNRNIFFVSPQLGLPLLISVAMPLMWHTISPGSFSNGWIGTTSILVCKIFWILKLYQVSKLVKTLFLKKTSFFVGQANFLKGWLKMFWYRYFNFTCLVIWGLGGIVAKWSKVYSQTKIVCYIFFPPSWHLLMVVCTSCSLCPSLPLPSTPVCGARSSDEKCLFF